MKIGYKEIMDIQMGKMPVNKQQKLDELKTTLDSVFKDRFVGKVKYKGIEKCMIQTAIHQCYNTSCFVDVSYRVEPKVLDDGRKISIDVFVENKKFWSFETK